MNSGRANLEKIIIVLDRTNVINAKEEFYKDAKAKL